jgi:hypothetical protein
MFRYTNYLVTLFSIPNFVGWSRFIYVETSNTDYPKEKKNLRLIAVTFDRELALNRYKLYRDERRKVRFIREAH